MPGGTTTKPESTEGGSADGVPQAQKSAPVFGDNGC